MTRNKNNRKPRGMRKGVALLPNLLTTANMFCGYFSIIQSIKGNYTFAVWLVVLAGFFDFWDGRVARMTNTQSDFGVEYDSLADLCTFGMAPAILAYEWGLHMFGRVGVAACFLYFCCGALRLARFNVQSSDVERVDFQGMPSPAAAGIVVSYTLFHEFIFGMPENPPVALLVVALLTGLLMVSNVVYKSAKGVRRRTNFLTLIGVVALIFLIASQPEIMLFSIGVAYTLYGVIGWVIKSPQKIKGLKSFASRFYGQFFDEEPQDSTEDQEQNNLLLLEQERESENNHRRQ